MHIRPSSASSPRRVALLAAIAALVIWPRALVLPADQREERIIGPGVRWQRWVRPEGPWVIHIVEADLSQSYIQVAPLHAGARVADALPISEQAARVTRADRYPIAAVNGDYFVMEGDQRGLPIGVIVRAGEVYHNPFPRSALVVGPHRPPRVVILRMNAWIEAPRKGRRALDRINNPRGNGHLVLYTAHYGSFTGTSASGVEAYLHPETPTLMPGVDLKATVGAVQRRVGNAPIAATGWVLSGSGEAAAFLGALRPGDAVTVRVDFDPPLAPEDEVIGGGPRLVRSRRVSVEDEEGILLPAFAARRHPRTAVGYRDNTLFLVTVDGRQPGYSDGMTLEELARLMVELGCQEALNLDGGGSTTMWVRGAVRNRPSDGRERAVANGLAIFSAAPKGPPARLVIQPGMVCALPGTVVPLTVEAEDPYYNPVSLAGDAVRWQLDPALGTVDEHGQLQLAAAVRPPDGQSFIEGRLRAEAGEARAEIPVRVYGEPPRLEVVPALVRLLPGQKYSLSCRAFDEGGRPIAVPEGLVRWSCDPALGSVDERGVLAAGPDPAAGYVTAAIGATRARAQMAVGSVSRLVDGFEEGIPWQVTVYPREVKASAAISEGRARGGTRALALSYDFTTTAATRAAYAQVEKPLGAPFALRLAVFGDGTHVWLRARLRDAAHQVHTVDLTRDLNWTDAWREVVGMIPPEARPPLTLESIYVVEPRPDHRVRGCILLDDLRAEYPPEPPAGAASAPKP
ncbi:MAG: phosphodiester glycosidase family protein [Armatimonadetes bacterium]|nr:phosphodiester glycosidase family protein [Armatimonadota bacterium]